MHAKITHYKGWLILDLLATKSIDNEVATSIDRPSSMGQVIMDTHKHLGVSAEAIEAMKKVKRNRDAIGDIDWFTTKGDSEDSAAFGWLGGPKSIKKISDIEGARTFSLNHKYVVIPNEVPEMAAAAIDEAQ